MSTATQELAVTIENVIFGIRHIADTPRKINVKWEGIVRFLHSQKKSSSTSPQRKEEGKGKGSYEEKVTIAFVNIVNHRLNFRE